MYPFSNTTRRFAAKPAPISRRPRSVTCQSTYTHTAVAAPAHRSNPRSEAAVPSLPRATPCRTNSGITNHSRSNCPLPKPSGLLPAAYASTTPQAIPITSGISVDRRDPVTELNGGRHNTRLGCSGDARAESAASVDLMRAPKFRMLNGVSSRADWGRQTPGLRWHVRGGRGRTP